MKTIRAYIPAHTIATFILAALWTAAFQSCDESLPPRDDIHNYMQASISVGYINMRSEESMYFTIFLRNMYTETFSDTTEISGYLTIQLKDHPEFIKTFTFTPADLKKMYFDPILGQNITTRADYFPQSKVLTVPENAYTVLQVKWDLLFDDDTDLREMLVYKTNPLNPGIQQTDEVAYLAVAVVHLYQGLPVLYPLPLVFKQRLLRPIL